MEPDRPNPHQHHPQSLPSVLSPPTLQEYPWKERWLRGQEYGAMLERAEEYCLRLGMRRCGLNQHPLQIYEQPENGMIYFMEGSLPTFGFPRVARRKNYRWKKMNFTTDLPKQHPVVTYLVASSINKTQGDKHNAEEFRMHVVVGYGRSTLLLCHIRQVLSYHPLPSSAVSVTVGGLQGCTTGVGVDFYRLFAFIHNHHWISK